MSWFRQLLAGSVMTRGEPADGLFQKADGTVWIQNPDGSEDQVGTGGSQPELTINSGPVVGSTLVPLNITSQPVAQPSGIIQPLPPLIGFQFPGAAVTYALDGASIYAVCTGPDGNVWAADGNGSVWKITPQGVATQFALADNFPISICVGADGNIYAAGATNEDNGTISQLLLDGTETTLTNDVTADILGICSGPDGNLWAADQDGPIYRITLNGTVTSFASGGKPYWICAGPDGNLWACGTETDEVTTGLVWLITTAGVVRSFPLGVSSTPTGICVGADGNLWVSDSHAKVWRVTPSGDATSFSAGTSPYDICAGAGGDLWIADQSGAILEVTTRGDVTSYATGTAPDSICSGPDGSFWLGNNTGSIYVQPFIVLLGGALLTGADLSFAANTQGPVLVDQSDGHTYRIVSTAGILSTMQVT